LKYSLDNLNRCLAVYLINRFNERSAQQYTVGTALIFPLHMA